MLDCIPFIFVENLNFDHVVEKKFDSARFLLSKSPLKQTLSNRHIVKYSSVISVNETVVYIAATNITCHKLF